MIESSLFPFYFRRFDKEVLMTNIAGDYLFVPDAVFSQLVDNKLIDEEFIAKLKSRFFICDPANMASALSWLKVKYQTKRSYLFNDSLLLMVVPTLSCNCNCVYCQASSKDEQDEDFTMTLRTALRFCDFVMELPHCSIKIEFQGGEPTLAFEVVELIVKRIKFLNRKKTKEISFVICTNLLEVSPHQISILRKYEIAVSTSLDGNEVQHNRNRPSRCRSSTYSATIKNVEILRKNGIYPSALVTITAQNLSFMKEIIDTYINNGFTGIFIRPLNNYGYAFNNKCIYYSHEAFITEYRNAIDYIIGKNLVGVSIQEEYFNILLRKILSPFNDGFVDMQNPCALGTMCMIVDQRGDVYPSDESRMISEMDDHTWRMGNIYDNSVHDEITQKKREILRDGILETYPPCAFCAYIPYCSADPIRLYYTKHYTLESYCGMKKAFFDTVFSYIKSADERTASCLRKWAND